MTKINAIVRAHAIHPPLEDDEERGWKPGKDFSNTPLDEIKSSKILAREILNRHFNSIPRMTLTIDCETYVEGGQRLRFGFAALHGFKTDEDIIKKFRDAQDPLARKDFSELKKTYCFHNLEPGRQEVSPTGRLISESQDLLLLGAYCREHNIPLYPIAMFANRFAHYACKYRACVIGHNLFFDLTRMAFDWSYARKEFSGGFNLIWCDCHEREKCTKGACSYHPAIRTRKLGPGKTLYKFSRVKSDEGKKHQYTPGAFLDTNTFCKAVMGKSGSLSKLCESLGVATEHCKLEQPPHGEPLTREYIEYARRDPIATRAVFDRTFDEYAKHKLHRKPWYIFSEASMGKAYLAKVGLGKNPPIKRFILGDGQLERKGEDGLIPAGPRLLGLANEAFYGGRADVGHRVAPVETILCDFTSQYPTVQILMGLQEIVVAEKLSYRSCLPEVLEFLKTLQPATILNKEAWRQLRRYVRILPQDDVLPVRTRNGISTDRVTSNHPLWYSLPDVCASVLHTKRVPRILEAIEFVPTGQVETTAIDIFGNPDNRLDLRTDEMLKKIIELRLVFKNKKEQAKQLGDKILTAEYDGLQWALKILANSLSYGIYSEINIGHPYKRVTPITVWTGDGNPHTFSTDTYESLGKYYYPPISSLITGGGRLLLAVLERMAKDAGLRWAFCDTDGFAFAPPKGMNRAKFVHKVKRIVKDTQTLSIYNDGKGGLVDALNIEKGHTETPVYAYAVSPKRYALFQVLEGEPDILKFTEHGLGGFAPPEAVSVTAPWASGKTVKEIREVCRAQGGRPWIYEAWYQHLRYVVGHDARWRDEDETARPLPLSDADFPEHARQRVTLSTAKRMGVYGSKMPHAWPGNFFTVYTALEGKRHVTFYREHVTRELGEIQAVRTEDAVERTITPRTLGDVLAPINAGVENYHFYHENVKAANGMADGAQYRRRVLVVGLEYMSKEIHSLSDREDGLPGEDEAAVGEAVATYEIPMTFNGSPLTSADIRGPRTIRGSRVTFEEGLQISIDWQLKALREKLSAREIATVLGTTPCEVWRMMGNDDKPRWITFSMFQRFQAVREELFRLAFGKETPINGR